MSLQSEISEKNNSHGDYKRFEAKMIKRIADIFDISFEELTAEYKKSNQ